MDKNPENSKNSKVDFSFRKKERLCSKKLIDQLFSSGNSFLSYPLKIVYSPTKLPDNIPVQVAFTASKKGFKKAVTRNAIKRKMREAYRLNKAVLYEQLNDCQITLFFIYIGKDIPEFSLIDSAMKKGINKLLKEISG